MWIGSKIQTISDGIINGFKFGPLWMNSAIRTDLIESIMIFDPCEDNSHFGILFNSTVNDNPHSWRYDSKEDRDQEYEWILSILDCKQNIDRTENSDNDDLSFDPEDNMRTAREH